MSISDRIEDGRVLWENGRKEGALAMILIAAAATSRIRYPRPQYGDREAFKSFIRDELPTITETQSESLQVPFLGQKQSLEDILYVHLRCSLVHEAAVPEWIEFTEPEYKKGEKWNILFLRPDEGLGLPEGWVLNLAKAVREAPENLPTFQAAELNELIRFPCFFLSDNAEIGRELQIIRPGVTRFGSLTFMGTQHHVIFTDHKSASAYAAMHAPSCGLVSITSREDIERFLAQSGWTSLLFDPVIGSSHPQIYSVESVMAALKTGQ